MEGVEGEPPVAEGAGAGAPLAGGAEGAAVLPSPGAGAGAGAPLAGGAGAGAGAGAVFPSPPGAGAGAAPPAGALTTTSPLCLRPEPSLSPRV